VHLLLDLKESGDQESSMPVGSNIWDTTSYAILNPLPMETVPFSIMFSSQAFSIKIRLWMNIKVNMTSLIVHLSMRPLIPMKNGLV
jgi:hypothetical protein